MDASNTQAFDASIRQALTLTRDWVPRWLGKLHSTLRDREHSASHLSEKQGLVLARTTLETHRDLVATRFLAAFAESVQNALPHTGSGTRRSPAVSFDELELMGDDQVQETVELARVQQIVKMAVDEELVTLTSLLNGAQGLSTVHPDANPLRADVVVAALMTALKGLHVDAAVRTRWLQTGAITLGDELRGMYVQLARELEKAGVKPAGYVVTQTAIGRQPAFELKEEAVSVQEVLGDDNLLTLDHLHQLLVGNLDLNDKAKNRTAVSENMMGRTLASEVVTLMLKRIASDERLLAPVRDQIQEMKPALLQLARSEPRFFADKENPARRLLDAITERSLAFTSELDPGFGPFSNQVRSIVRTLLKPGPDLSARFPGLLDELKRSQAATVAPAQVQARGLAVQTLVRVEQRNLLAERVAAEMRARNDFDKAPGVVRRFLTGPWSQVVAQARLESADAAALGTDGQAAALRYNDILPDLLWSSQLALASLNRPRLVKVIPGVLRTLREGLDAIDYPREQAESFFQALMGLHEAAYKTQRNSPPPDDQPSIQPEEDDEPWMQRTEARDSCLMDDTFPEAQATTTQPAFLETQPMQRDWADVKAEMAVQRGADALPVGTWVDVLQDGQAMRWQITWASPHGTMFLFTSAHGRSLSMTKRGLERLLEQDRLRVVANHGVVDEALDEVARQAWLNSAKAR